MEEISCDTPSSRLHYFYGWDLLYRTISNKINKKDDLLIALAHFILTKHMRVRCIGLGDDRTLTAQEEAESSELLPDHWNSDSNNYVLRYIWNGNVYILNGMRTEGALLITLLDPKTRKVTNICLSPEEIVKKLQGDLLTVMPTACDISKRFSNELFNPLFGDGNKTTASQTGAVSSNSCLRNPLEQNYPDQFSNSISSYSSFNQPQFGRGDLDPLARGGGNLFPFPSYPEYIRPNSGGNMQPRFDPMGPPDMNIFPNPDPNRNANRNRNRNRNQNVNPNQNSRQNPDPDHLPQHYYGDDYFL